MPFCFFSIATNQKYHSHTLYLYIHPSNPADLQRCQIKLYGRLCVIREITHLGLSHLNCRSTKVQVKSIKRRVKKLLPHLNVWLPPFTKAHAAEMSIPTFKLETKFWDDTKTIIKIHELLNGTPYPIYVKYRDGTIVSIQPDHNLKKHGLIRFISGLAYGPDTVQLSHEDGYDYGDFNKNDCQMRAAQHDAMVEYNSRTDNLTGQRIGGIPTHGSSPRNRSVEDFTRWRLSRYLISSCHDYKEEILRSEFGIYLEEPDVVIASTEQIIIGALHPYSLTGNRLKEQFTVEENKLSTNIYIVDNANKYQERYITIGGLTFEVPIMVDPTVADGFYFTHGRAQTDDPDSTPAVNFCSVEEAEQKGMIRNRREEVKIDLADIAKIEAINLARDKAAQEELRAQTERNDKLQHLEIARKESWFNNRIRDVIDVAKLVLPLALSLFTIYLKIKKPA